MYVHVTAANFAEEPGAICVLSGCAGYVLGNLRTKENCPELLRQVGNNL